MEPGISAPPLLHRRRASNEDAEPQYHQNVNKDLEPYPARNGLSNCKPLWCVIFRSSDLSIVCHGASRRWMGPSPICMPILFTEPSANPSPLAHAEPSSCSGKRPTFTRSDVTKLALLDSSIVIQKGWLHTGMVFSNI